MICTGGMMDRQKLIQQSKILKDKKLARIIALSKQLRPQVKEGVVKYPAPVVKQIQDVRQFAAPPPPIRVARTVIPKAQTQQQQDMRQQNMNPKKIVRKQKGCSGCRRKSK